MVALDPEPNLKRVEDDLENSVPPSQEGTESKSFKKTKSHPNEDGLDLQRTKSIADTLSLPQETLVVGTISLAQFTTQVGVGQALSTLYVIGEDFGITNPGELSWLIAGFSLTVGTFILISGRFGDLYGYKRMLILGFSWYALWSMVAGLSVFSNKILFVFARVLSGIGPAITLPNGLALLGATYAPGRRKEMVFAIFGATAPGGSITGSVFGALFALTWWPWTYWSFAITLAIITVVAAFVIPDPPLKREVSQKSQREKLVALDLPGAVTGITALVFINFAWNQAPIVGWSMPYVYVCLILGFLIGAVFFYIELKVAPFPLLPFECFSTDVCFVLACVACGWGCFGIWIFYLWNYLLESRGISPLLASAYTCPVAISGALAAICTGYILGRVRPPWVMTAALSAFLTGTILIATAPVDQTYWAQIFVCCIIMPWGMDMSFPAATLILSNHFSKEHQGVAASLVNTVVNYSISLGLGFAGTVEVHVNNGGLTPEDQLRGYRGALYMGVGLAGLGVILGLSHLAKSYWEDRRKS